VSSVHQSTVLFSPDTGVIRARELGEAYFSPCYRIGTLWMPDMHLSGDVSLYTDKGWKQASEVQKGDWLCLRVPDHSSKFHVPVSYPCEGPARYAYPLFQQTLVTEPVRLIDMMCCPNHVAHWRVDKLLVTPRLHESYYWGMVSQDHNAWWHCVLETDRTFQKMVELEGFWEAYGFLVKT